LERRVSFWFSVDAQLETLCTIPYFAYGSNMNFSQMAVRCPGAEFVGAAFLPGYRFHIYSDGYATVLPDPDCGVWGGVWMANKAHMEELDHYEGVPQGCYYRLELEVNLLAGNPGLERKQVCWVYFSSDTEPGLPRPGYMEGVIEGARDCGLPDGYLPVLRQWLP
jgi:gamma-glutamylcyclotransferase (GGCT)/AIG2-like uncharacterized protein YtfP